MKHVATRLVSLYGIQAVFTCAYITLLGVVGERFAERVRNSLFESSKPAFFRPYSHTHVFLQSSVKTWPFLTPDKAARLLVDCLGTFKSSK